jgi:tetratricopeptide (TPR) repeat protein
MKKTLRNTLFRFILLLLFISALEKQAIAEGNLTALVKKVQPAVVTVITYDMDKNVSGIGSGFFVDKDGHLITNHHVLKGAYSAEVRTYDGQKHPIYAIVAEDEAADLIKVLVDISTREVTYVTVSDKLPAIAERIVVVGSPLGLDQTVSEGIVSSIRKMPAIGSFFQMSAPISPGSSGSPVMNMNGKVVGVATFQAVVGQNLNFAVSGKSVKGLKHKKTDKTISQWAFSMGERKPWLAEELCKKGFKYSLEGEYNKALQFYEKATEKDPDNANAWFGLGYCYAGLDKSAEAIKAYKQGIQNNPNDAPAYQSLANYYHKLGRHKDAIETYKQVIGIDPDYGPAHFNLGILYAQLGMLDEGKDSLQEAIRINPSDASAYYYMGLTCGKLGQYEDALKAHQQVILIKPNHAPAHFYIGMMSGRLGLHEKEMIAYKQAIRINPDYAPAHFKLGEKYLAMGDKSASLAQYKILMDLDRDMADQLFDLIYQ